MKSRPSCSDWFKKVCTKIESSADIHNGTAPTDFANHLDDRFQKQHILEKMHFRATNFFFQKTTNLKKKIKFLKFLKFFCC